MNVDMNQPVFLARQRNVEDIDYYVERRLTDHSCDVLERPLGQHNANEAMWIF